MKSDNLDHAFELTWRIMVHLFQYRSQSAQLRLCNLIMQVKFNCYDFLKKITVVLIT